MKIEQHSFCDSCGATRAEIEQHGHRHSGEPMYTYQAKCIRVVDGDTVDLDVDLGFHMTARIRFRLLGIDAPELRRGTEEQKAAGRESKKFLEGLLLPDAGPFPPTLVIRTEKADSFGRWLCTIEKDGVDVGITMIDAGHATVYA